MDVIERDWEKAIKIVERHYPHIQRGSPEFWSIVFGVVKRMRGRKSAKHLQYLGVLEKARKYDPVSYLPYIISMKVKGTDLWLDLPPHPAKEPPSALPSLPLVRSTYVDKLRQALGDKDIMEFAQETLKLYTRMPLIIELPPEKIESLAKGSSVVLFEPPRVSEEDEVSWKLVWIYGMIENKIQPISPRWGYRLSQMSRRLRDLAVKRIDEHLRANPLPDPFATYPTPATLEKPPGDFIVVKPSELTSFLALLPYRWQGGNVLEAWQSLQGVLSNTIPAIFAYALHQAGLIDLKDVKILSPNAISPVKVLAAFTDEDISSDLFPIYPNPEDKGELEVRVRVALKENKGAGNGFTDEIVATLSPKWLVT